MRVPSLIASLVLAAGPVMAQSTTAAQGAPLTLAELEQMALANNPTSAGAAAAVDAARARMRQAGSWPNPLVGYSGEEIPWSGGEPRGEHGFFVEQAIPLGGKLRLSRSAAQQSVAQAEAVRELQQLRILNSVHQLYFASLLAERRIEVQERLAALVSEAVGVTAQLFNVGAADRPDYLEIEIEARRMQLQLGRARNEALALKHQLALAVGSRDVVGRPLAGTIDAAIPELEQEQLFQRLREQSPMLRAARAELERARALTSRARREPYPDLLLRGGSAYNRERGDTNRAAGWQAAIEVGISVPLFNRNAGGIAAAGADERRAEAELSRLELALESRAAAEFARYLTALRAAESYRSEILPRAEEAYRLYLARYREMAAAYPQVLVAQRTLLEMSSEYLESLSDAWQAALNLQGLLAGDGLDAPGSGGEAEPIAERRGER